MFKRIKQAMGMVGVKVDVSVPPQLRKDETTVQGTVRITAESDQTVKRINIRLIQRITDRDDDDNTTDVDTYELGREVIEGPIELKAGEAQEMTFTLHYQYRNTLRDVRADQGGMVGTLVGLGQALDDSQIRHFVTAVLDLENVMMDPNDRQRVDFI